MPKDKKKKGKSETSGAAEVEVELVYVPVGAVTPHPDNPRVGASEKIKESIRANGFLSPIVVQKSTEYVLAGNHRLEAAKDLGMMTVPALIADLDDRAARRFLLADNRAGDDAVYDTQRLAAVLESFEDDDALVGTAYSGVEADVVKTRAAWQKDSDLDEEAKNKKSKLKQRGKHKERREDLEKLGRRSMMLSIPVVKHAPFVAALKEARESYEVNTNEELLVEFLKDGDLLPSDFSLFEDEDGEM